MTSGRLRPLVSLLFAAALLLQAMVPAGWMPSAGTGGPGIVLCTGTGAMPMPDMPGMAHGSVDHHAPGLFGALPATPPALAAACPTPSLIVLPVERGVPSVPRRDRGLGMPPRPSTGPPTA